MGAENVQYNATITPSRAIFFFGDISWLSSSGSRLRLGRRLQRAIGDLGGGIAKSAPERVIWTLEKV